MATDQVRTYDRASSVVFLKTKESFGGLSNMAAGYPLHVNDIHIRTSEALYQACRFPHLPQVQAEIIAQKSPMTAKMKSKPHRTESRSDWNRVRIKIMRWCLRAKLAQNLESFGTLLQETGDRPIVEQSKKDGFWGAKPTDDNMLIGMNVLGRLLMELREMVKDESVDSLQIVQPLDIPEFLLKGEQIRVVGPAKLSIEEYPPTIFGYEKEQIQGSLFEDRGSKQTPQLDDSIANFAAQNQPAAKPYSAMKDSGLAWVGEVPEHWDLIPNRAMLRRRKVLVGDRHSDNQLLSLTKRGIIVRDISSGRGKFSADMGTSQEVRVGDLVFCLFDVPETPRTVGLSAHRGMITGAYTVFECRNSQLARFLEVFYIAMDDRKLLSPLYSGLRNTIRPSTFLGIKTPTPPRDEQAAIVRYLNHVDRRVQRLVQAKRKLIELLTEEKQAIIHRAVTRGLDPNVPLKDSGVEWLGNVPEKWDVVDLKRTCLLLRDGTHLPPTRTSEGFPLLSVRNIIGGKFELRADDSKISEADYQQLCRSFIPQENDVLLAIVGATLGKVAIVPSMQRFHIQRSLAIFRPKPERLLFLFLSAYFNGPAFQRALWSTVAFSAQPGIYLNTLGSFAVVLPPRSEQLDIVSYLDGATTDIDTAISSANREIDLVREYRTRIIADVVTGKLDVRAAAAALPQADPLDSYGLDETGGTDLDVDADELEAMPNEAEA